MREGLRNSTVSQRPSGSRSRRDRASARSIVKAVSDGGVVEDCDRVRNLLPDLNSEANNSESEGGYGSDDVVVRVGADESVESKGVGEEDEGEVGKDLVGVDGEAREFAVRTVDLNVEVLESDGSGCDYLGATEEVVLEKEMIRALDGNLRVTAVDLNVEVLESDSFECNNLGATGEVVLEKEVIRAVDGDSGVTMVDLNVEVLESDSLACNDMGVTEEVILEKDMIRAVDGVLQPEMESNHGFDVDIPACIEDYGFVELDGVIKDADCNTDAGGGDLQARPAMLEHCSENAICSADRLGDRMDMVCENRKVPVGGKVLRSRVVGITREGQTTGYNKRERATGCQAKEAEMLRNDDSNEELEGKKNKAKVICGNSRGKGKESILLKPVLQGEKACAEELKIDENNGCFDGQSKRDNDCWERSSEKGEDTSPLTSTIGKDEASSEMLNNGISKEVVVNLNQKGKVGRGRGRPRKQQNDNNSENPLLEKIEASSEDAGMIKQAECIHLTDGAGKQPKGIGRLKKRKRGRPKKIDSENNGKKPILHIRESTGKGEASKEQQNDNNSENPLLEMIEASSEDVVKIKPEECNQVTDGADKQLKRFERLKKRKRGRPRKTDIDNDGKKPILHIRERIGKGGQNDANSENPLLEKIEASSEDLGKIQQEECNQLTDGADKQLKWRGRLKKSKRGRPRKIDTENDGKKPILHIKKRTVKGPTGKGGAGIKKQDSHQSVECTKNPSAKDQANNSLSTVLHNDEAVSKGEVKIEIEENNELVDAANKLKKVGRGRLKKGKRGRPKKINKESDAEAQSFHDMEAVINTPLVVKRKEDAHRWSEAPVTQERKQIVEGTQIEMETKAFGTASHTSSSRLKRKRENTEEKPSISETKMSSKGNVKARSSTREEKQMVRLQIVDMLKNAGWTVEYKPRQGREYADSVYRCPEGRTHWSVTLAYRVLKKQVELGKASSVCFTPIPEETLSTLFRVTTKSRSDKNKPRQNVSSAKLSGKGKGRKKKDYTSGGEEKTRKSSAVRSGKQNRRRCALLVRGSGHGSSYATEEFTAVSGKHSILSWMIKSGVVPPGGKVHYRGKTRVLLDGSITRDGIHCNCCNKLHSVSQFEVHAGNRSCPMYENLYLDNGSSLLDCQMESWNKQEESIHLGFHKVNIDDNDPNDDTCGICGDGGNLICCDGCPSTFHQACLNIQNFPSGDWHCVYCSCKYCGTAGSSVVDQDNEKHHKSPSLLTCCLCDGKYHQLCADEKGCLYDQCIGSVFCGKSCEKIYEHFQRLVGVKAEVGDGYTCTLIKRPDVLEPKEIENVSKLAVALSVMEECFLPIIDHRSGINLMRHTLYSCGSNFKRLNFKGFFTAILEKDDEIICAASIRIHGKELAEMPFIGTRNAYRRRGMCRRLLNGIESALRSLGIEKLVIPAVSEVAETWTSVFGFEPLGELGCEMRYMNIIVFPGVDMLQKPLLGPQCAGETTSDREEKAIEPADSWSKKQAEENGLMETKVQDSCLSEHFGPSNEALQDVAIGSHFPLDSAAVDQEVGSKFALVCPDTADSSEENKLSTLAKDDRWLSKASDQVVSSPEELFLESNLSFSEDDACEVIEEPSKSLTTSDVNVFEDHVSRLVVAVPDDTAPEGCNNIANTADACSDYSPAVITAQFNSSLDCPINPSENAAVCNGLSSSVSFVNDGVNPAEGMSGFTCSAKLVGVKFHEVEGQSLTSEENMSIMDQSIPNGAQVTAKTPDLQIDCKIVTQFNLEKSCNMDSSSNDLGTPVSFHAPPEVRSK